MTKVLSRKIDALSPDLQAEVLRFVDYLMKKEGTKRMTLDNYQDNSTNFKQAVEEQLTLAGYRFW
jgi:site-specific recombinase XerD